MIHLDTSFLIHALRTGSAQEKQLVAWLSGAEDVGVSAFAWAELLCGPLSSAAIAHALELLGEPVPIDRATAERAAHLFNASARRRGSLADCFIAAAAIESSAALATENRNDFARFTAAGLLLAE